MNEIKQATLLIKQLTQKILELKATIKDLECEQDSGIDYYAKYQKAMSDNLALKDRIAQLETTVSLATFELEKRNKALMQSGSKGVGN